MRYLTRVCVALVALPLTVVPIAGQDTTLSGGVTIGIDYVPGVRPGLMVFGGERTVLLDSVRAIVRRDLEFSDEFEMIALPMGEELELRFNDEGGLSRNLSSAVLNYTLYAYLGADWVVNVHEDVDSTLVIGLFDVNSQSLAAVRRLVRMPLTDPEFRLSVHRVSDDLMQTATGVMGIAASRLLFVNARRIYRVDSDGAEAEVISPPESETMSPSWSRDGRQALYMEFPRNIYLHDVATRQRRLLPLGEDLQHFTPVFHPDGERIAFSRGGPEGTDIFTFNIARNCCLERLTVGRLYDNLSPTFSPDGRRMAFISNRPGMTQVYVMSSDGTGQELFAPFEWGVTGPSNAPEWSPDGRNIAFHREVARSPQIFVMEVATRSVKQLTSFDRNYDPTWAPDGRHLAFVSERTGSPQVWVIDIVTGTVRQLTRLGQARLPDWSPRIAARNTP